jgi:anti-sigma B factor antagonist
MTARQATSFTPREHATAVVVEARGELDVGAAPAFRTALQSAADSGCELVVVDLHGVSFLDSAALSVVIGLKRQLPLGRRVALVRVPTKMLRVLRVAAIGALVEVYPEDEPWPWPDVPEPRDG